MILLSPQDETSFDSNGLGALSDALLCTVTEERNGMYEVEMQYPLGGIHYDDITNRCIVMVKPGPWRDPQPFRIYRITKPLSGRVTIYARHISYDLSGVVCSPFSAGSATEAMLGIKTYSANDNPFNFVTDVEGAGRFEIKVPTGVRSFLGGSEGSLLDVYGGEYEFDRWTVRLRSRRGQDRGVSVRYGKNLTDLQQDENIANVATGVYPYWTKDNQIVQLPEKYINADGDYPFTRIVPMDLSAEFDDAPTADQLRDRAKKYMADNKIGVPTVSITVAFQALEQTDEYKDIALLEKVDLCDTVTVEYADLGVSATAKCIKTVYDALADRYTSIELGNAKSNFVDAVIQQKKEIEEKIPKSSAWQEAIDHATKLITGNVGGYVILRDANDDGMPDEILIMDTDDINTAKKVWRWNTGGLAHSSNGYNGPFEDAAITMDGQISGRYLIVGSVNAEVMTAGILKSSDGKTWINLNNGQFQFLDKLKLVSGNLYIGGRLCDMNNTDVYAVIGSADGHSEAFKVHNAADGDLLAVYETASGNSKTTIWTPPVKTNASGTNRKGVAVSDDEIAIFGDYNGKVCRVSINTKTGAATINGATKITVDGSSDVVIKGGGNITVDGGTGVTITGGTGDISITGKSDTEIQGVSIVGLSARVKTLEVKVKNLEQM